MIIIIAIIIMQNIILTPPLRSTKIHLERRNRNITTTNTTSSQHSGIVQRFAFHQPPSRSHSFPPSVFLSPLSGPSPNPVQPVTVKALGTSHPSISSSFCVELPVIRSSVPWVSFNPLRLTSTRTTFQHYQAKRDHQVQQTRRKKELVIFSFLQLLSEQTREKYLLSPIGLFLGNPLKFDFFFLSFWHFSLVYSVPFLTCSTLTSLVSFIGQ